MSLNQSKLMRCQENYILYRNALRYAVIQSPLNQNILTFKIKLFCKNIQNCTTIDQNKFYMRKIRTLVNFCFEQICKLSNFSMSSTFYQHSNKRTIAKSVRAPQRKLQKYFPHPNILKVIKAVPNKQFYKYKTSFLLKLFPCENIRSQFLKPSFVENYIQKMNIAFFINSLLIMGNSTIINTEGFNQIIANQWDIISDAKCIKYVHKISRDQFILKLVDYSQPCQTAYRARQFYSFQENPKIYVVSTNQTHIQLLVQDATYDFESWLSQQLISLTQALVILRKLLQGILKLRKKFGCFYLTKNMVKVNKNNKILLWINENFENNSISYKLPQNEGQQTMITKAFSYFGSLLGQIEFKNVKTINQAINLVNKILLQKTLLEVDKSYHRKYSDTNKNKHGKSFHQIFEDSNGIKPNKSYKLLVNGVSKNVTSPRLGKKSTEKNCQQNETRAKQNSPFILKLNPVEFGSHTQSMASNMSQSSKTGSQEKKIQLQKNFCKTRNTPLFISMGGGETPKNLSCLDTQQENKDMKIPFYQKNLKPIQIPTNHSTKNINNYLKKTADDTFSCIKPNFEENDENSNQVQMKQSGQLPSPVRRQIHSQLSKIL